MVRVVTLPCKTCDDGDLTCTRQSKDPDGNYGLLLIITYQYWLIHCNQLAHPCKMFLIGGNCQGHMELTCHLLILSIYSY